MMDVPLWQVTLVLNDGTFNRELSTLQVRAFTEESALGKARWVFRGAVTNAGSFEFTARKLSDK